MRNLLFYFIIVLVLIACKNNDLKDSRLSSDNRELQLIETNFSDQNIVSGEIIYIPIYSSIFSSDSKRTIELTATMSIHNVDLKNMIKIKKVDYYDGRGSLVKKYLDSTIELKPLETKQFVIEHKDKTGGTGANFIVEWISENEVISPLVEAVMISTSSQLGISFTTSGKVIEKLGYSYKNE